MTDAPPPSRSTRLVAGDTASITVVVAAFVVALAAYIVDRGSPDGPPFSPSIFILAVVLGIVYLALILFGRDWLEPFARPHTNAVTMALLVILMLAIEFLLQGTYVIWLISMPLIAAAASELPPRTRWFVYLAAMFGVAAPIYLRNGNWLETLINTLTFLTAFVFVLAFVRLNQAADQARTEAEELAAQLADANRRLGDYAVQAEELATIQERNRLAREIHDNIGHYLTVVNVQINAARALIGVDSDRADAALDKAARLTQEGLAAIRQSISSLRESPLGRRSLAEAVAALIAETQAAGIVAELRVAGSPRPLDARHELTLYRAAQEGLTNVRKHARASRVDLTLDFRDPAQVSLAVCDNGVGHSGDDTPPGFGLLGLQERARQLGGEIVTHSAVGQGYCLTINLPTNSSEPAGAVEGAV